MARNIVVIGALVLVALLAGETEAAVRNPDGVAVIIGNRAYQYEVPQVTYAHRDAAAFRRYVVDVLGFDPENVIHEQDADKATMERVFGNRESLKGSELWRYLHQDGISDVVVFYSGHGIPGLNDKRGYLLPVNTHPDTAELNGYPIDVLYQNLIKLKEQEKVRAVHVFLDACFSGDSGGGRLIGSTSAIRVAPLKESAGLDKLTILTAASDKEVASWDRDAKHGLFTHHLLNALYGAGDTDADGQVTATEAKVYLDHHMTRAARRTFGRVQNADLRGKAMAVLARAVGGMFPARPLIGQATQTGHRFRDCPSCPEMVVVPAGSYEMGSPISEVGRQENEGPVHRVTIAEPFAVGVYEVTRGEFRRFVEATGYSTGNSCATFEKGKEARRSGRHWRNPGFPQTDQHPVVCVSWQDAQAYVRWLSQETGQTYRLLTEAEWEYVARAGTRTARYWGQGFSDQCLHANGWDAVLDAAFDVRLKPANDEDKEYSEFMNRIIPFRNENQAVDCDDGYAWTSPVGVYGANAFGLHDMLGNAWEAVQDCWNDSYVGAPSNGKSWESGNCSRRVLRGGSWVYGPGFLRAALRGGYDYPRSNIDGFRIARTLTGSEATLQVAGLQQEAVARQPAEEARTEAESPKSLLASLDQQMVHVEGGAFTMGCTAEKRDCADFVMPAHRVQVGSFEISKYEVTQALWEAVMGENPSEFKNCSRCPVENVNWDDIQAFLKKLNTLTGERYRLPTEAEWEYAARGGQQSRGHQYAGSDTPDSVAWYNKNSGDVTHPVGQKHPNELGLYDMSGNVWEWVANCWNRTYTSAPSDRSAWESGDCSWRGLRGGSSYNSPKNLRSTDRSGGRARNRVSNYGFRIARTLN